MPTPDITLSAVVASTVTIGGQMNPPATGQRIELSRGDSLTIVIPVKYQDGTWQDLTEATARWWVGRSVLGAIVFIKKESGDGLVITNPGGANGEWDVVVTLDPSDTENLHAGAYYHECEIVDHLGYAATVTTGPFVIKQTLIS
jgi:hypothetical protein